MMQRKMGTGKDQTISLGKAPPLEASADSLVSFELVQNVSVCFFVCFVFCFFVSCFLFLIFFIICVKFTDLQICFDRNVFTSHRPC